MSTKKLGPHRPGPLPNTGSTPSITVQRKSAPARTGVDQNEQLRADASSAVDPGAKSRVDETLQSSGQSLEGSTRRQMESHFQHDCSSVRVHSDSRASASANAVRARAYTAGSHIVFGAGQYAPGSETGRSLLRHELAHVVQQTTGPVSGIPIAPGLSISDPSDRFEREAQRHAENRSPSLATGRPIRSAAPATRGSSLTIQRFESDEHKQLGDASASRSLNPAKDTLDLDIGEPGKPQLLTYGEMVALAGDFFGSLDEMRKLTTTPDGRAKLRWIRWYSLYQGKEPEPAASPAVKKEALDHYYDLASKNISHFSGGGAAVQSYKTEHEKAIRAAYSSGLNDDNALWTQALTIEAFGNHYLTDSFSGGHVRTPRADLKKWYSDFYPTSIDDFVSAMADSMRDFLIANGDMAQLEKVHNWTPNSLIHSKVKSEMVKAIRELGGKALDSFSLGDIVSGAIHDMDNRGLDVVSIADEQGKAVAGGNRWVAMGDSNLMKSPPNATSSGNTPTFNMATAAISASIEELKTARIEGAVAKAGLNSTPGPQEVKKKSDALIDTLKGNSGGMYAAERFIPHEVNPPKKTSFTVGNMDWRWGYLDPKLGAEIAAWIKAKLVPVLRDKANGYDTGVPGVPKGIRRQDGVDLHVKDALNDFASKIEANPIKVLEGIVGPSQNMSGPASP